MLEHHFATVLFRSAIEVCIVKYYKGPRHQNVLHFLKVIETLMVTSHNDIRHHRITYDAFAFAQHITKSDMLFCGL